MPTKKLKSTGRFGPRYGLKTRRRVLEVEKLQKARHACPYCLKMTFRRDAAGVWTCRRCGRRVAGGAYLPTTVASKIMHGEVAALEIVAQKEAKAPVKEEVTEGAKETEA